jgi:hypothetical protein
MWQGNAGLTVTDDLAPSGKVLAFHALLPHDLIDDKPKVCLSKRLEVVSKPHLRLNGCVAGLR